MELRKSNPTTSKIFLPNFPGNPLKDFTWIQHSKIRMENFRREVRNKMQYLYQY
ncbi:unnamed protein product [Hymenolepis diminuta]|uniref:Uncharacterized protein n=1 Tax=Hymenolepis diminuta TaxID=6216 RepID=A0A564YP86_HYMDI|nr:unnamed protein product [Hymenolepis diminuta]VUZ49050.1 unnamed protein product [Hymenolepis diminuta]